MKVALVVSCGAALACSGRPSCPASDLDCIAKSFAITDFSHFDDPDAREKLTALTAPLPDRTSTAVHMTETGNVAPSASGDGSLVLFSWTDTNGCRPGFCMSHCPRGVRCFGGGRCTPARRDGLTQATTTHWIQYTSDPDADATFDLVITPVSAPGCPTDVAERLNAGDTTVALGPPIVVPVHLPGPDGGSGGGGGDPVCGTGLHASTLACTPLGSSGVPDTCVTDAEYRSIFGTALPSSCAPSGTTGCLDTQKGALVKPCCPGLTCKVGTACGGTSVVGGTCL